MGGTQQDFRARLDRDVLGHAVIRTNPYTAWFKDGTFSAAQARAFLVQFSVFSNQFLVAQLQKMINEDSLSAMRAAKEILANEIGVVFRAAEGQRAPRPVSQDRMEREGDPELVSTT